MKLFVGLGNPGVEYARTRHNAGFMAIDLLATHLQETTLGGDQFSLDKKSQSLVYKAKEDLWLAKPQQFMNKSGSAIRSLIDFYSLFSFTPSASLDSLYVVHDDLDLELGAWKLQFGTGPKIHNGLLSLYQYLGTKNFWHVRVGIDGRGGDRSIPSANYVLQRFPPAELEKLRIVLGDLTLKLV